jgi:hypothetical protein
MQKFSDEVYQAQTGLGSLGELLRANGSSAKSVQDAFSKVADLVQGASTNQQKLVVLQQAGLPATQQWVNLMSQGSSGIKDAIDQATKFGDAADEQMIAKARAFDESWNKSWTNFSTQAKTAIVNAVNYFDDLEKKVVDAGKSLFGGSTSGSAPSAPLPQYGPPIPAGGVKPTVDPNAVKQQLQVQQQLISSLGQLASVDDVVKQKELEIQQARLSGIPITQQQSDRILTLTRATADGTIQAKSLADTNTVQAKAISMTTGEAAAYTYEIDKVNEANRLGVNVSQAVRDGWHAQGEEIGKTAQQLENAQQAFQATSAFVDTFVNSLVQGKSATEALGASLQGLGQQLTKIGSDQIGKSINNQITTLFGSLGALAGPAGGLATIGIGAGIGLLGNLFGGGQNQQQQQQAQAEAEFQQTWSSMAGNFHDFITEENSNIQPRQANDNENSDVGTEFHNPERQDHRYYGRRCA